MKTMLFNPYTGRPRHPSDIASDPAGFAMVDPDTPLRPYAAPMGKDTAALIEIDKVMLESGADWPDMKTDAMVVRHVKQLTRMMNETATRQAALCDQVRLAYMSGTDDFRRFYDAELFAVIGVSEFRELYAPLGSTEPQPAQGAAVIGFYKDEREPRLLSWNRLPDGEHWLYTAPQPAPVERKPLSDDEIRMLWWNDQGYFDAVLLARAVEKHHGIKGAAC